ncbi:ADP-ribosylation factor-binding protein GGA1, partial [Eschrichtius robustus]|nr:ADP-ribosylation factor-binding protein GGA1 [Eschrichtius robustus]
ELYQRCERLRPTLFRLASDTEDNDEALAEILQANDNLTQVINLYKQLVRGEEVNGDAAAACIPGSTSALLDLSGLDLPPVGTTDPATPTCPGDQASLEQPSTSVSLLDDELMSLGQTGPLESAQAIRVVCSGALRPSRHLAHGSADSGPGLGPGPCSLHRSALVTLKGCPSSQFGWAQDADPSLPGSSSDGTEPPHPTPAPSVDSRPPAQTSLPTSSGLDDLDLLGKTLLQQSLPPESQQVRWEKQQPAPRLTLRDLQNKSSCSLSSSGATSLLHTVSPEPPGPLQQPTPTELSLANITVPLESIKPTHCDEGVMKVKLQPPSGTELPAFNPIVHPSAITQVLLLANPQKEKVRLRYKLLFTMGDQTYNEMGDVDQFPPPETWGSL